MFNEENLFACGRDFRLGSFATDAFRASVRSRRRNDLEFIVARQRLLRSNNNVRAAHHASNVALVCERDGDNRGRRGLHTGVMASENCAKGSA